MTHSRSSRRAAVALAFGCVFSGSAAAHGYAGSRFFPATLATDDPFAASELSLPTFASIRNPVNPDGSITTETDVSADASILLLPRFAVGFDETWTHLSTGGEPDASGFGNLGLSAKWNFFENDPHEALVSIGLDAEIGGTGSARVGADDFTTYTPTLYWGKGMGDLPVSLSLLRPFAITGTIGVSIPERAATTTVAIDPVSGAPTVDTERHPHFLQTGIAIEYSMPYLRSAVKDYSLPEFFNHLIPLVEISLQTGLDRGNHDTTGFVNPGLIYSSRRFQVGVEATVPVNPDSAHDVGVLAQLHFYLDDVAPGVFSRPIFGRE